MGQASASASQSQGFQTEGGIYYNPPNYGMWIVLGLVAVLAAIVLLKRKS